MTVDLTQPYKNVDGVNINLTVGEIAQLAADQAIYAAQQAALAPQKNAAAALAAGIVLTSTGTPALNGTYATNAKAQADLNAIITYILLNNAFPAGVPQMPWPDSSGTMHLFPSTASFQAFATILANFVATVTIYGNSGGAIGSIPSNQLTIP